jgi:hypothetical protein
MCILTCGDYQVHRWWQVLEVEHTQHPCSDIRRNRLQGSDKVSQKACGVVIPFVQRQPGNYGRMKDEG